MYRKFYVSNNKKKRSPQNYVLKKTKKAFTGFIDAVGSFFEFS